MNNGKPVIYQMLPRLFANRNQNCVPNGTIEQNGSGKMNDITSKVLRKIKDLGITHIWYTGIIEHSVQTDYSRYGIARDNKHVVKGKAGSPYAIKDYYDVDPDIAVDVNRRMEEFEALLVRTHDTGMRVIVDFVPNHVSRQYISDAKPRGVVDFGVGDNRNRFFDRDNNFYYIPHQLFAPSIDLGQGNDAYVEFPAKASGNDCFTAFPSPYDWYETVKLNYGIDYGDGSKHFYPIPKTWFQMLDILRYWAEKGVDGFRCDMAHMVPIEFWQWAIPNIKERYPHIIFIAEIYDVALYRDFINRGGFDYLYDKVNLYDTLRGIQCHNVSAAQLTHCWQTVDGIGEHMLNFLENHDEQRFGSKFYAGDPSLVIPSLVVSAFISTGPMMIYAGQELGEQALDAEGYSGYDGRTTIFDYWSVPTLRRWFNDGKCDNELLDGREIWLREKYIAILRLCNSEKAIARGRFFDLMYVNYDNPTLNPHRQYVFLRSCDDETLIVAVNFSSESCSLKINIPRHAFDVLSIPEGDCVATELLSKDMMRKNISSEKTFDTEIGPNDAVVWKIKHKNVIDDDKKSSGNRGNNSKKR
ncbi:MAG TPA: alpha-amylase family glycosyl hydrolase [Muribaculum sp.]|jgi:glycosidase|uniref:Alpha-amylase family glycosyl hydrolase n=1 Tax=Heminiphilus faecis TaxID=2601703 RepID=A0ABV4CUI5_9BACT|nr:alpha-amylase family glycosyl hydrolase [Heminiphilus faecis]RLT76463.1 alpha-amylase [bacterium J10(2018)]HRF68390.1 alpha-amylase family glycosyl hydrolase [Muribaculum sp.]